MGMHDRAFKGLMRLLPAEFRGEYEREMAAAFRAERGTAGSRVRLTRVWLATIADVFRTAPGEHLDILKRDLAYTLRMLARRPALSVTAILTLALGIGANTAIFSVVNGVLFAPFDYRDADEVVIIGERRAGGEGGTTGYLSYVDLRDGNSSLESIAALGSWLATLAGDGKEAERVVGARVTWNYFRTVGLAPAIGRDFEPAEDHPERRRVAIISDALWRRRYGADPTIIGRQFTVNQVAYTLAGVLPADAGDFITAQKFPGTELWTLLGYAEDAPQACRSCRHIQVVGRLRDGVTPQQAEADLTRIYQSLGSRYPAQYDQPTASVSTLRANFLGPVKTPLYLLWGAVGLLLLIACANIANLLLIRASEREEEIAIRRALGVSPARMLRQLLTEAVVLALVGGAAGAAVASWATTLLTANGPAQIPRLSAIALDGQVLAYALVLSLATGVLFGMAPARLLIARRDVSAIASRRTTAGPGAWRYRAALIAGNVALSALLLVGSGLLIRSFVHLLTVETGFTPQQLLTFQVSLIGQPFAENAGITRFYDEVTERLRAIPGVVGVSGSTQVPLTGSIDRSGITIDGRPLENPAAAPEADTYAVRPDYFATMGIPVLSGRAFDRRDGERAAPVAIVSRMMAEQLWPGEDPIGRRIRIAGGPNNPMRTIVGIVGDIRHYGLHLPVTMQVYLPHSQTHYPQPFVTMVVRTSADREPASLGSLVREQIRSVDALQPVSNVQTFDDIVAKSMATRRFTLVLLAVFAGTALLLAIVGLYGALAFIVSQRHREIGVRVALGASGREIRALVMRQGMTPATVGAGAGLVLSLGAGRVMESMLFGTSPRDAVTYAVVVAVITASALAACLLPARRAASIDPAVTLRAE